MANVFAVHSVGNSIATFLQNTYPESSGGQDMPACTFDLLSSGALADGVDDTATSRVTLYLYRITVNEHSRQQRHAHAPNASVAPLSLDLHFMLSAWAGNALDEQVPLTWAIRQLHEHPLLDASSLSPEAGWHSDEVIQIIPAELSTEDLMRIWDSLSPTYRLSASYIARVVRIDPDARRDARPVVATRLAYGTEAVSAGGT
ncbi:DUF4255 domain-containing protein [Uliginosibacterium sp. H1]|uniref:DUF4255 domain-containing protein n=1 Tax=Uliginosibacterium sp. H1 TaxID=3114757 RepID=UPI002E198D4B|nr:DUF4255 domain-containing protein [Uliginosibacterium sp. H1]